MKKLNQINLIAIVNEACGKRFLQKFDYSKYNLKGICFDKKSQYSIFYKNIANKNNIQIFTYKNLSEQKFINWLKINNINLLLNIFGTSLISDKILSQIKYSFFSQIFLFFLFQYF